MGCKLLVWPACSRFKTENPASRAPSVLGKSGWSVGDSPHTPRLPHSFRLFIWSFLSLGLLKDIFQKKRS